MYRKWVEISQAILAKNSQYCKSILSPNCMLMAVVKANAYGHGSVECSKILLENGTDWLGTSSLGESLILRENGITAPILCLGIIPPENISQALDNNITITICDFAYAASINEILKNQIKAHIKLDTGMNRLGFYAKKDASKIKQTVEEIIAISGMQNIEIEGIFTHFWGDEYSDCKEQFDNFQNVLTLLQENGINPKIKHCCNSNAAFHFPGFHLDMCRVGEKLYGYHDPHVTPAMEFKSIIVEIKDVEAGEGIGYTHAYIADKPIKIAVLPVGYADGYFRLFSNKASVCVNGEKAHIVGNVCMDMLMIDVTNIEAKIGDIVTIYGRECVTIEDLETQFGIYPREITCDIGRRVPRVYI